MADEFQNLSREDLIALIKEKEQLIEYLQEQLNLKRYEQFSSKSEKSNDPKDNCFDEAQEPENIDEIEEAEKSISVSGYTRKSGEKNKFSGRKPLPDTLPREEFYYDLDEHQKTCTCGADLSPLKDSIYEQLEIIPAKLFIKKHIKKNYCCSSCDIFKSGTMPKQPIPKSLAGPGLLSHILVSKYQDHLPLYRMEQILNRIGVDIARSTLASWVIKCAKLLEPMYQLLIENIVNYDVAYADETTVQVLKESDRKAQSNSYMWVFGGGSLEKKCYVYSYDKSRAHNVPLEILKGFSGYLHSDGYAGYDALANALNIKIVGCWYHVRRKFIEVQKVTKKSSGLSGQFLDIIKKLSIIEAKAQELSLDAKSIYELRQKESRPLIEKFKKLLDDKINTAPEKSLLGTAMRYSLKQWPKLTSFLEDGRLEISNNLMERKIKPFVIGRKNWLFYDSVKGAKAGAIIYSLIETCKEHNLEPYKWFSYIFKNIYKIKENNSFNDFLPYNFDVNLIKPPDNN